MSIKCISFFEDVWLSRGADRAQWKHVTNAYGATFQLYDAEGFTWNDEEHNPDGLPVYVFDETGSVSTVDAADAIYVFGNTRMDVTKVVPAVCRENVVRINTPKLVCLWGNQAAAIALAYRHLLGIT